MRTIPPNNATFVGISLPAADVAVGVYPVQTDPRIDPMTVGVTAAAYPVDDAGKITNWADLLVSGTVWLTSVSSTEIDGAVSANDPPRGVDLSGTFAATICARSDGGR